MQVSDVIGCGLQDYCMSGPNDVTAKIVKPPSRYHVPGKGDHLYENDGTLVKMVRYIFNCDHLFCEGCSDPLLAVKVGQEIYVEGNNVKVLVADEARCPICKALQIDSQFEMTEAKTIKLKGTTGLEDGDINEPNDPRNTSAKIDPLINGNSPASGNPASKKLSKKTIKKIAVAGLAALAVLAAILIAVMLVV